MRFCVVREQTRQRPTEHLWPVRRVRVREEQEVTRCDLGSLPARPGLPHPPLGKLLSRNDQNSARVAGGHGARQRSRLVVAAIIDDDDLEVRVRGRSDRGHAVFDVHGLIARGDGDTDAHRPFSIQRPRRRKLARDAREDHEKEQNGDPRQREQKDDHEKGRRVVGRSSCQGRHRESPPGDGACPGPIVPVRMTSLPRTLS